MILYMLSIIYTCMFLYILELKVVILCVYPLVAIIVIETIEAGYHDQLVH